MAETNLYPIAVLIDDLKNEDIQNRLNSMRKLDKIAEALGPERTRNELIPFLNETIDDEDEVLLVLAESLGNFIDLVGGPQHIPCLLTPLEQLAAVEEPTVRDMAITSLDTMANRMSDEDLMEYFVQMIRNLFHRDWFTSRISVCSLFVVAYPRVSAATKAEFRGMFGRLCRDDTPMVRRAAASSLGSFAEVVEPEHVKVELMPMFKDLAGDDQDSVRLLAVKNVVHFASLATGSDDKKDILDLSLELAGDMSWRVRWSVADSFVGLVNSLGTELSIRDLVPAYVNLLKDEEAEVRTAAVFKVTEVAALLKKHQQIINETFIPELQNLATDSCDHVRSALACVIMSMAPVVGKDTTVNQLLDSFLRLLKDDVPEVRLNIISKLDTLNNVIGIELLVHSLMPSIVELAKDRNWRIRLAIIQHVPLLAEQLGVKIFEDQLADLSMQWLEDEVFSIRQAATDNIRKLTEIFGEEWARQNIIPKVLELNSHSSYLCRMQVSFLFCLVVI
uniref:Phosphatase PP2A regulatory subunit A/Splicing factor 3B subunit 1-like HEAT repeat domain-containing protein n=1 Tax=Aplanochytrium stocchinoi TaxID=215587 RepID=A0A7S3UYY7_9STRA